MTMMALPDEATRRYTISSTDKTQSVVVEYRANETTVLMPDISDGVPIALENDNETYSEQIHTGRIESADQGTRQQRALIAERVAEVEVPDVIAAGSSSFKTQAIPVLLFQEKLAVFTELAKRGRVDGVLMRVGDGWTAPRRDEPTRYVINVEVYDLKKFLPWFAKLAETKFACLESLAALDELANRAMTFQLECLAKSAPLGNYPNNWTFFKL